MTRYLRALATLAAACALMGAAGASAATPDGQAPVLTAPVAPLRADALFVAPAAPWASGHRGVDLLAAVGQVVVAPGDGVVAFSGRVVDRGVVTVDHGGGVVTSLEPVSDAPPAGTAVARGEAFAVVGEDPGHCAPATCLHWGVRVDGVYVDPLDLLEGFGPVVLLPLAEAVS
ncbi:M23 family metallopeptidase [Demequina silvatica]|uniref:M23 family metallopeptidase n=1 Tax=Demequina silvatica TaxID=1638988 RepID=UPI000AB1A24F|nr:M23 family metallopeptidase [Demequina silvatica]